MIQQRKHFIRWLITLIDILIIIFTYWLAVFLRALLPPSSGQLANWYIPYYIKIFPIFLLTFAPIMIMNNSILQAFPVDKHKFYIRTISFLFLAVLISIAFLYYFKLFQQSRVALFIFFVISAVFMMLTREYISNNKNNSIKTLVFGKDKDAEELVKLFSNHAFFGIDILNVIEKIPENITQRLKNETIDWVVIMEKIHKPYIFVCEKLGITVSYCIREDFEDISSFVSLESSLASPMITFHSAPPQYTQLFFKYTADRVIAFILLIFLFPLFVLIPILIKLTSRGPVIYKHERAGLNGRRFEMLKFRTMFENADRMKDFLLDENEMDKIVFKIREDPRITNIGKVLRRLSLDELPQLINVLRGEMSLVGPRPPLPEEVNKYEGWERKRLSMKPGITCLWQISGRAEIGFDEWMKLDLEYIDNWSLGLDIVILRKTIPAVIKGRGAY